MNMYKFKSPKKGTAPSSSKILLYTCVYARAYILGSKLAHKQSCSDPREGGEQ